MNVFVKLGGKATVCILHRGKTQMWMVVDAIVFEIFRLESFCPISKCHNFARQTDNSLLNDDYQGNKRWVERVSCLASKIFGGIVFDGGYTFANWILLDSDKFYYCG